MNPQRYPPANFDQDLAWMRAFTPATARAACSLSSLSGERIPVVRLRAPACQEPAALLSYRVRLIRRCVTNVRHRS